MSEAPNQMIYLWIALGLWLPPAAILGIAMTVAVANDIESKIKNKPYYRPMTYFVLSLLVALGALSVLVLINS